MNDDHIPSSTNEGDWFIYMGIGKPIPFGSNCRCKMSYPGGASKGPVFVTVLEVVNYPDFETNREPFKYASKREMLGDWVPSQR